MFASKSEKSSAKNLKNASAIRTFDKDPSNLKRSTISNESINDFFKYIGSSVDSSPQHLTITFSSRSTINPSSKSVNFKLFSFIIPTRTGNGASIISNSSFGTTAMIVCCLNMFEISKDY